MTWLKGIEAVNVANYERIKWLGRLENVLFDIGIQTMYGVGMCGGMHIPKYGGGSWYAYKRSGRHSPFQKQLEL